MRAGTPGFVGARLREGREARGLTAIALSEILGVSRQAVSQYENSQQTPRPEIMLKIEQVLGLPLGLLFASCGGTSGSAPDLLPFDE